MEFAQRVDRVRPSAIRELLMLEADPEVVSFGGGYPDASMFPMPELNETFNSLLRQGNNGVLQYCESVGLLRLREQIAERSARDGTPCRAEDLQILQGAQQGLDLVATGHTRTDHAETIIFRIARGTGRTGALGIAPRRDALIRPLLTLSRHETREWCELAGVSFTDDPTNEDLATARARVRHGAMPALSRVHPAAEAHLARLADLLRDESEVIDAAASSAWDRCARDGGLGARDLAAEPAALARLLVRRLIAESGLPSDALGSGPVERVRARAARGRGRDEIPGGVAVIERGVLVVSPRVTDAGGIGAAA